MKFITSDTIYTSIVKIHKSYNLKQKPAIWISHGFRDNLDTHVLPIVSTVECKVVINI